MLSTIFGVKYEIISVLNCDENYMEIIDDLINYSNGKYRLEFEGKTVLNNNIKKVLDGWKLNGMHALGGYIHDSTNGVELPETFIWISRHKVPGINFKMKEDVFLIIGLRKGFGKEEILEKLNIRGSIALKRLSIRFFSINDIVAFPNEHFTYRGMNNDECFDFSKLKEKWK